jgi:hypothetical protein
VKRTNWVEEVFRAAQIIFVLGVRYWALSVLGPVAYYPPAALLGFVGVDCEACDFVVCGVREGDCKVFEVGVGDCMAQLCSVHSLSG